MPKQLIGIANTPLVQLKTICVPHFCHGCHGHCPWRKFQWCEEISDWTQKNVHSQLSHIQSLSNNLTHISATFQPQTGVEQEFLWHLFCTSPHSAIKLHFKLFSTVSYTCLPVNCFQLFRAKNELQYNWATYRKNVQNNRMLVMQKKILLFGIFSLSCAVQL